MATETKIQWTDSTFNPWRGCTKIASGCTNCYADTLAKRNPKTLGIWGPNGTRVLASDAMWREPVKWNMEAAAYDGQHRVFCASLADIFEDWPGEIVDSKGVTLVKNFWSPAKPPGNPKDFEPLTLDDVRMRLFQLIDATPNLTWQILTKRPGNIRMMWPGGFRKNVHLLYSASDQQSLVAGIHELLKCRKLVPVLGVSAEPLVGQLNFDRLERYDAHPSGDATLGWTAYENCLSGFRAHKQGGWTDPDFKIDWVIVGGESGPGARPCNIEWIRSIVNQCREAGVPCFVKQLGGMPESEDDADAANSKAKTKFALNTILLADKKGGDWDEWPEDLRVREFPGVKS